MSLIWEADYDLITKLTYTTAILNLGHPDAAIRELIRIWLQNEHIKFS